MKPIYKALLALGVLVIAGVGIGFYSLISEISGPDQYDVYIGREAVSPDGKKVATFYTISGGGAAGYVLTRLNLRPKTQAWKPTKASNDYVFELRHGDDLDLQWQGNNKLNVVYEAGADTYDQLNSKDGVKISYQAKVVGAPSHSNR